VSSELVTDGWEIPPTDQDDAIDNSRRGRMLRNYSRFAVLPILVAVLIFSEVEVHNFFTWSLFKILLSQNASLGIIAVGLTFVLISGCMDISVGAVYAAGASVYTKVGLHSSMALALLLAILVGIVAGVVNGILVTKFKFNPFVTTLSTASLFGGLVVVYAGNNAVTPTNPGFGTLGNGAVAGIPYSVILLVAVVALGTLLLHRTSFGRSLYATGGSPAASRLAGLNIDLFRLISYVISGGCAALAGVLYASQTGVSESNLGGNTVALTALAIVVLGGTSLFGGEGAMWRTVAGFIILASVTTLFSVLAVTQPFQDLIEGLIVVVALVLDASARRRGAI
jgi:ribose transport system permease protein